MTGESSTSATKALPEEPSTYIARDIGLNIPESGLRLCLRITFGKGGNSEQYQTNGWFEPEEGFAWSSKSYSSLLIPPLDTKGKHVTIIVRGFPFQFAQGKTSRCITLTINGIPLPTFQVFGQSAWSFDLGLQTCCDKSFRLEARYHDTDTPSSLINGSNDERVLAFAWQSLDVIAGPAPALIGPKAFIPRDKVSFELHEWAVRELLPWMSAPLHRAHLERSCETLNATEPWAALFHLSGGHVRLASKPRHLHVDNVLIDRAKSYLPFLQSVVNRLPPGYHAPICISTADFIEGSFDIPVFVFQKLPGEETVLVPDVDFVQNNFYEDEKYVDCRAYPDKAPTAVFAGSTTGGQITKEIAEALTLPRLHAAAYFENNIRVDFRLTDIVQCESQEAVSLLKAKSFCARPRLSLEDQFRHRFIISMDGNGAAWSRVVVALLSNSVMIKYYSPRLLYYFDGMQPNIHYAPVNSSSEVQYWLDRDTKNTTKSHAIALAGRIFASDYLSRERVGEYMANLLSLYLGVVHD